MKTENINIVNKFLLKIGNTDLIFRNELLTTLELKLKRTPDLNVNRWLNDNYSHLYYSYTARKTIPTHSISKNFDIRIFDKIINGCKIISNSTKTNFRRIYNEILYPISDFYGLFGRNLEINYVDNNLVQKGKAILLSINGLTPKDIFNAIDNGEIKNIKYGIILVVDSNSLFITLEERIMNEAISGLKLVTPDFTLNNLRELE